MVAIVLMDVKFWKLTTILSKSMHALRTVKNTRVSFSRNYTLPDRETVKLINDIKMFVVFLMRPIGVVLWPGRIL